MRRKQLFCLPPAGSGPNTFRAWVKQSPVTMEVVPLTLPGREGRMSEPVPDTLEGLAEQLTQELIPQIQGEYALFGYSMGALLSYEIAKRLHERGIHPPSHFFVLAAVAPYSERNNELVYRLPGDAFKAKLAEIGGTPKEILECDEIMEIFEPILRHDFMLCETYAPQHGFKVDAPMDVFSTDNDRLVSPDQIEAWRQVSTGTWNNHAIPGQHMVSPQVLQALLQNIQKLWNQDSSPER